MNFTQQVYDASEYKQIDRIDFSMLPNDMVEAMSSMKGTQGVKYADLVINNEPKSEGLIDALMGPSGDYDCKKCKLSNKYCDGHPGHIYIREPLFNVGYTSHLRKVLECICLGCSNLYIAKEGRDYTKIAKLKSATVRLKRIHKISQKAKVCIRPQQDCGIKKSVIRFDKKSSSLNLLSIVEVPETDQQTNTLKKSKKPHIITAREIARILDKISPEDAYIMGIDTKKHIPSDTIYKILPVPPVSIRPSVRGFFSSGSAKEDGITHTLAAIVKANNRYNSQRESKGESSGRHEKEYSDLLQASVATLIDANILSNPKDNKNNISRSLSDRYQGKGRIRGNIQGKRGDFNARTVITSDPTISVNHFGVPVKIAREVTLPIIVTPTNIDQLTKYVRNGPDVYPGANYVFKRSSIELGEGKPIVLKFKKEEVNLTYGDVVERHLITGDPVLVNRQPSLHKQSMMTHRIKVINDDKYLTFRLSPAVCPPYNADFDGDEMNFFLPQSHHARIELEEIADVKYQIISPSTSKNIIGIVQDGLFGSYNMTDDKIVIDWRTAMNILSYTNFDDYANFKKVDIPGKDLFSLIIPPTINIKRDIITIENGKITAGRMSKSILGIKQEFSIIHYIWDDYGPDATRNFIDNCQRITNHFNLWNGFTVGPADAQISKEDTRQLKTYIANIEHKIDIEITNVENNPNFMTVKALERNIYAEGNVIRDDCSGKVGTAVSSDNHFNIMKKSGSKGDANNLGQMIASVGLQVFAGGLVQKIYNNRTMCYVGENDDRFESSWTLHQFLYGWS